MFHYGSNLPIALDTWDTVLLTCVVIVPVNVPKMAALSCNKARPVPNWELFESDSRSQSSKPLK